VRRSSVRRPKLEDYDDFVYLVVHGASVDLKSDGEVHFILADHFLVTIRHGDCPAMDGVHEQLSHPHRNPSLDSPQLLLIYLIIDQLIDSFFPMLDAFDNQIDELEDAILVQPTDEQLGTLFTMKRQLIAVRKVITPQRDMFANLTSGVTTIPGISEEGQRYLRSLYDHTIRISDLADGYRDLLSSVMDTHLSTVSNRLNVVMKQLTIIATVFLPLSFLTGFFGQNFSYLVGRIGGPTPFYAFGIGLDLLAAVGLLYLFRRRGWLGGPTN
jgi:magnesium transporter